jgi:hypothetical protein
MDVILTTSTNGSDDGGVFVGGVLTPPEELLSSPVSAKGSILFRFWIAELATPTS